MKRYIILNTENNKQQGFKYGYTTEKPVDGLDYRAVEGVNGTEYDIKTPRKVVEILEKYRQNKSLGRLELDYGNAKTGQSWGEIHDINGYIGRSTGIYKIPILVHNSRSTGGIAILDYCIVRIRASKGKQVLYQHLKYKPCKY